MIFKDINEVVGWCNTIIPTIFDDSLSYLEMVGKLKCVVNDTIKAINVLGQSNNELMEKYNETIAELKKLQDTMDSFIKGYTIADKSVTLEKLADDVLDKINDLVVTTVKEVAKFVSFELDDEGYFVAFIPEQWKDIEFDTTEKGELMLKY